ncbi:MAG: aminodeoxychorismate/anthranilate synthase component II [Kiloniellales bacterium]|nr:aminodeoxychorismate/anthranilate synthase component II [Kiloniellales bacterium]
MKVLLVDAYDSFVFIIEQYLKTLGLQTVTLRCDDPCLEREIRNVATDFILLGPGPGRPEDARYPELIREVNGAIPILGVCLGHQAIGLAFGGNVICAGNIMHGKSSLISNDGLGVFTHTSGKPFMAARYHSLIVSSDVLPPELVITANSDNDGYIMGLRHRTMPIEGVQFHPESIATDSGLSIFDSFLKNYLYPEIKRPVYN